MTIYNAVKFYYSIKDVRLTILQLLTRIALAQLIWISPKVLFDWRASYIAYGYYNAETGDYPFLHQCYIAALGKGTGGMRLRKI